MAHWWVLPIHSTRNPMLTVLDVTVAVVVDYYAISRRHEPMMRMLVTPFRLIFDFWWRKSSRMTFAQVFILIKEWWVLWGAARRPESTIKTGKPFTNPSRVKHCSVRSHYDSSMKFFNHVYWFRTICQLFERSDSIRLDNAFRSRHSLLTSFNSQNTRMSIRLLHDLSIVRIE